MQTINELLEDNTFCGESLKRHCEAIIKYRKQTGGKKTLKRIIAAAVFEDSDTKADTNTKNLSSAFVFDKNNPLLTFGDKTRQEMLQDIRRIYADDIMAIGNSMPLYAESPLVLKSHFLFKQYFMTDADENTVAAGELRLFYTSEYGAITYESFTLHIAEGKNYDAFDLEGTIKRYGTTLVLNSDFPTYFGTTIIQTDDAFFAIGPQPDLATLYHGSYLTYSKANETIEGNILLAAQPIDAVIAHYDTPPHIAQYLFNTFKKLSPPAYNNQLPETKQKQALQTSPPPAFLVGTYKQFFIHATERAISV
ncbi:MAG: hypothetical protein RI894_1001, partial [Bacteroidota bacterium]